MRPTTPNCNTVSEKRTWSKEITMDRVAERFRVFFRALRVLRRIVVWGGLALLAPILVALAINAFDERPSREALALLPANSTGGLHDELAAALKTFLEGQ